jgi:hypothetical protein
LVPKKDLKNSHSFYREREELLVSLSIHPKKGGENKLNEL